MSTEIKAGQTLEVEHTFTGFKLKVSRVSKDKYIIEVV